MSVIERIVTVGAVNRSHENLIRRLAKTGEEIGEAFEAYLSVTSDKNGKSKVWEDVQEEAVDCLIMCTDIAATYEPKAENLVEATHAPILYEIQEMNILVKLAWLQKLSAEILISASQRSSGIAEKMRSQLMVSYASSVCLEVCENWSLIESIANVKLDKWTKQIANGTSLISENAPKI